MNIICEEDLCSGCYACINVCSKNAITMIEGNLGHLYPVIDQNKCIDCNLCIKVCPSLKELELRKAKYAYAATSKNKDEKLKSASGGVATIISKYIINNGGKVYGCKQNKYNYVSHVEVKDITEISSLQGSKYVQSQIGFLYREIKENLNKSQNILFIGTPCQVAGLKSFLRKEYKNLYTIDLVCHGVPSQKMLTENIEYYLKKKKISNMDIKISFRRKTDKGIIFGFYIYDNIKNKLLISKDIPNDHYMNAFLTGLSFRESCHNCLYAKSKRVGDMTIADFWGLKSNHFIKNEGVSLVLVNNEQGKSLFENIKDNLYYEERNIAEAIYGNNQLQAPFKRPDNKDEFIILYKKSGLVVADSKCSKSYIKKMRIIKIKKYIYSKLSLILKK